MATTRVRGILRHLQQMGKPQAGPTDAELLERFVRHRDEAAFELLTWRHGTLVLGLCQRMLRHRQDAEDVFQATWLTFFRKAATISKRESLSSWLYKVAYRTALRAQQRQSKQLELLNGHVESLLAPAIATTHDLRPLLDEEIQRLPARYRLPVILCYLEGKTNAEAAQALDCPRGTIGTRLARARERLRSQLVRRGITLSASSLGLVLANEAQAHPLTQELVQGALRATSSLPGVGVAGTVATLSEGVLQAMFWTKVKVAASIVVFLGALATGTGLLTYQAQAADPGDVLALQDRKARPTKDAATEQTLLELRDRLDVAEQRADELKKQLVTARDQLAQLRQALSKLAQEGNAGNVSPAWHDLFNLIGAYEKKLQDPHAQAHAKLIDWLNGLEDELKKNPQRPDAVRLRKLLEDLNREIGKLTDGAPAASNRAPAPCQGLHANLNQLSWNQCASCHQVDPALQHWRNPHQAAFRLTPQPSAPPRLHKPQMQGRWLVAGPSLDLFQDCTGIRIQDARITVERPTWDHRIAFTLNVNEQPAAIDLTPGAVLNSGTQVVRQGIARVTNDRLELCIAVVGMPRPKEFVTNANQYLITFKRDKASTLGMTLDQSPSLTGESVPVITINERNFSLPMDVDPTVRPQADGVDLHFSNDQGKTWEHCLVPIDQNHYLFTAPSDGEYWFTAHVRMKGEKGSAHLQPMLKVRVDTSNAAVATGDLHQILGLRSGNTKDVGAELHLAVILDPTTGTASHQINVVDLHQEVRTVRSEDVARALKWLRDYRKQFPDVVTVRVTADRDVAADEVTKWIVTLKELGFTNVQLKPAPTGAKP